MSIVSEVLQHDVTGSKGNNQTARAVTGTAGVVAKARKAASHGAAVGADRQARELEHLLDSRTGRGCGGAPG